MFRIFGSLASMLILAGCLGGLGGGWGPGIDDKTPVKIEPAKFRGLPVVRVSFVASVDASARLRYQEAYWQNPIPSGVGAESEEGGAAAKPADGSTAETNFNAMESKNVFYAFHLAKYLEARSRGTYLVFLNPEVVKHDDNRGFYRESYEDGLPPHDVDVSFGAYVHPNTQPSNVSDTTYGEWITPIVSVRVDKAFSSATAGAVGLPDRLTSYAADSDGYGARAQLVDFLNARIDKLTAVNPGTARDSGKLAAGEFYALPSGEVKLSEGGIPKEELTAQELAAVSYNPGRLDAFPVYKGVHQVVEVALTKVDNSKTATRSQEDYWAFYGEPNASTIVLQRSDRGKRRFLVRARQAELQYLRDRDRNWMEAVLNTSNFTSSFNELREAELKARKEFVDAQIQQGLGTLMAIGGAFAAVGGAQSDNPFAAGAGIAMVNTGLTMAISAQTVIDRINQGFDTAFSNSYNSQREYIVEFEEAEREKIRARDYADFRKQLKNRYAKRFGA